MSVSTLISPDVPTVTLTDTGNAVLDLMTSENLNNIPLLDGDKYIALLQENDLLEWDSPGKSVDTGNFKNFKPAIFVNDHPYDALRVMHMHHLSVVPVIKEDFEYLGAITKDTLLKYITENTSLDIPGGIIVLEVESRNYSLSEIARICENEQVIVVSSQVKTNIESGNLEITLKTNRSDLSALIQSFERHNYTVLETYGDKEMESDILDRYKLLMNYINM